MKHIWTDEEATELRSTLAAMPVGDAAALWDSLPAEDGYETEET